MSGRVIQRSSRLPQTIAAKFHIDPLQVGLKSGGGLPLPHAVRAKMEAALGADFSAIRVHIGPQAERIGALAFTNGNDIYFAPGRYQPDSAHGQRLLGHELTHVIQQRQGRVQASGAGVSVIHDPVLEKEADRFGEMAAAHRTANPGSVTLQLARNRALTPRGTKTGRELDADVRRARMRATLARRNPAPAAPAVIAAVPVVPVAMPAIAPAPIPVAAPPKKIEYPQKLDRPKKPRSLGLKHPVKAGDFYLTFHHKLNAEMILEALRKAIRERDRGLLAKLVAFGRLPVPNEGFIRKMFQLDPPTEEFLKQFAKFRKHLIWVPWNGFFGDEPEIRIDDPGHSMDRHFTASGNITPRTQLAHDVGPEFKLDAAELTRRLNALASLDASPYRGSEWGEVEGMVFQLADPLPKIRIVEPTQKSAVPRNGATVKVLTNDATVSVEMLLDATPLTNVRQAARCWLGDLPALGVGKTYIIRVIAKNGKNISTIAETAITSSFQTTDAEREAARKAKQARSSASSDVDPDEGFGLFFPS